MFEDAASFVSDAASLGVSDAASLVYDATMAAKDYAQSFIRSCSAPQACC